MPFWKQTRKKYAILLIEKTIRATKKEDLAMGSESHWHSPILFTGEV
jgi:hypothetical protein